MTLTYGGTPDVLCCDNETNTERLYGTSGRAAYPKDGINDHVVTGAPTVNPAREGSKAALRYRLTVAPGDTSEVLLRLTAGEPSAATPADMLRDRQREADGYYADLLAGLDPAEQQVARRRNPPVDLHPASVRVRLGRCRRQLMICGYQPG